jgi:colicin import membrane protein
MRKMFFVLAALPCFCFSLQHSKEPSLRIETLNPDGTKTASEMVHQPVSKVESTQPKPDTAQRVSVQSMSEAQLKERQRYLSLVISTIQKNWFVSDQMRGKECKINLKLSPEGSVNSLTVLEGDKGLCESAVYAVQREVRESGKFPVSSEPRVYDTTKDLTLTLRPQFQ